MTPTQSPTQEPAVRKSEGESLTANNSAGGGDEYLFRAPRHGDLVRCHYCTNGPCDYCGGERVVFASDLTFFEENPYV
ncbi:MAG: hypothetical protein ACK4FB_07930 [Brevundimonas sp.]|uniref:hypothetical protein n=1 Tax=Brevundimonas sp. TaxID=1871086 RepID=UPI0039196DD0